MMTAAAAEEVRKCRIDSILFYVPEEYIQGMPAGSGFKWNVDHFDPVWIREKEGRNLQKVFYFCRAYRL
jgi:hypothetical protein